MRFLRIYYLGCCGLGVVDPRGLMPRLCDDSSKLLCLQRDCQCDFGTKGKLLGFGGSDPNQCVLQDCKVLCCANASDCYCEVFKPTTICASVASSLSLSLSLFSRARPRVRVFACRGERACKRVCSTCMYIHTVCM